MKKTKKLISRFLCFILCLSLLPMAALAEADIADYVCFKGTGSFKIKLHKVDSAPDVTLEYSFDKRTWEVYAVEDEVAVTANSGNTVYFRGKGNKNFASPGHGNHNWVITPDNRGDTVAASGNIMTLLDCTDTPTKFTKSNWACFTGFFENCTALTSAPILPATELYGNCYTSMFEGCTSLEETPALPAKVLANGCYQDMFKACTSLTKAPALPAEELPGFCYQSMFEGCSSLTKAPELKPTTLGDCCLNNMFKGCKMLNIIEVDKFEDALWVFPSTTARSWNTDMIKGAAGEIQTVVSGKYYTYDECGEVVGGHSLSRKSANGQYWQECDKCDYKTQKKDVPEVSISGADKICVSRDYSFTATVPDGGRITGAGFDTGLSGDELTLTENSGVYSGTVKADWLTGTESFKLSVFAVTADGFEFTVTKNASVVEHAGGEASCVKKATCDLCGEEYGGTDENNHKHLIHVKSKDATAAENGNIEYWCCGDCEEYFSDEAATKQIAKADTLIPKNAPVITAGDGQSIIVGEMSALSFTSDAAFEDFIRAELDGKVLDENLYTKKAGSTVITLNADYVATLSVGEHSLSIVSENGTATAKFTVKAAPSGESPKTGDNSYIYQWTFLLLVGAAVVAGSIAFNRKRRSSKKT